MSEPRTPESPAYRERGQEPSLATATKEDVAGAKRPARQGQEREG